MQFAESTDTIYGAFIDYFGNVKMTKIKSSEGYAVYAVKVNSNLSDNRYVFAVVPDNRYLEKEIPLNNLNWVSLQTRTDPEFHKIPSVSLYLNEQRKNALSDILQVVERDQQKTVYMVQTIPIKVTLLHDPKQKNSLQFPDRCKLYQALETYNCVVELL